MQPGQISTGRSRTQTRQKRPAGVGQDIGMAMAAANVDEQKRAGRLCPPLKGKQERQANALQSILLRVQQPPQNPVGLSRQRTAGGRVPQHQNHDRRLTSKSKRPSATLIPLHQCYNYCAVSCCSSGDPAGLAAQGSSSPGLTKMAALSHSPAVKPVTSSWSAWF